MKEKLTAKEKVDLWVVAFALSNGEDFTNIPYEELEKLDVFELLDFNEKITKYHTDLDLFYNHGDFTSNSNLNEFYFWKIKSKNVYSLRNCIYNSDVLEKHKWR